jgi:hypothetical protein
LVPEGTQSLLFETEHPNSVSSGQLQVEIGTEVVPITAVGSGPNYTLYAANLSAWGGQTEQLTFSALEDLSGLNNWEIDDISFSPNAVPEPNSLVLTAVGGVLFAMCRRFLPNRR